RVAYLKGLAEGMQINDSTNEGKLLRAMIEVLDDIALAVDDMEEVQEQLGEQIDNMDEDLAEIERIIFDEEDDDDYDDEDFIAEIECPHCHETVELTEDMLDDEADSFECPSCQKDIAVEWDCDCEDCCDHEEAKQ
ncbi:MAG: CD1247 N-terminal domain-containing protein, partial [Bacillota bacterium]